MAQSSVMFTDINSSEILSLKAASKTLDELKAAATDYQNFGALLTPQFEREINDIARRRGVFGQLLDAQSSPATGHPHRWYDQYVLPNTGAFIDPRTLSGTTSASNGGSLRTEFSANVRALSGQINFGLFDQQINAQSSIFPQLVAKDLRDMLTAVYQAEDLGLFNGTATSLSDGASVQFCGVKTQATNAINVAVGVSIIDSIRTKVAQMMANTTVVVRPTHIFVNPLLLDLIQLEVKNSSTTFKNIMAREVEVVPGVVVNEIMTAAGPLPVVPCWEMATRVNGGDATKTDYPVFIASMPLIEKAWVGAPGVQVYKLGLVNDLADKYVAVAFNTGAILKSASYAHAFGYVTR